MNINNIFCTVRICVVILLIAFNYGCKKEDKNISDGDGNVYTSIKIGTQEWMVENLKTTKYKDGADITNVTDQTTWANTSTPAFCWYGNDAAANKTTYGALYNLYAVNSGRLCPAGWHVPDENDWAVLVKYLGGDIQAGYAMKESGITHWTNPDTGATNSSGFTALPGGERGYDGSFFGQKFNGYWWSTPIGSADNAYVISINYYNGNVYKGLSYFKLGASVRCLKD